MSFGLKRFLYLYEEQNKLNSLISYIVKNYTEEEIVSKVEQTAIDNYVPSDWEEDAESELEWYNEYGKGEAEDDVITNIIQEASRKKGVKLTSSQFADMQNWMYNAYSI